MPRGRLPKTPLKRSEVVTRKKRGKTYYDVTRTVRIKLTRELKKRLVELRQDARDFYDMARRNVNHRIDISYRAQIEDLRRAAKDADFPRPLLRHVVRTQHDRFFRDAKDPQGYVPRLTFQNRGFSLNEDGNILTVWSVGKIKLRFFFYWPDGAGQEDGIPLKSVTLDDTNGRWYAYLRFRCKALDEVAQFPAQELLEMNLDSFITHRLREEQARHKGLPVPVKELLDELHFLGEPATALQKRIDKLVKAGGLIKPKYGFVSHPDFA